MAYTGTGTKNDPYLVDNLTDFMTCINIAGVHVKVISDIDAREEMEYVASGSLYIKAARIYADELTKISGFSVNSDVLFYENQYNGGSPTIENLYFDDILFKPRRLGDMCVFSSYSTSMPLTFRNCKFSIKIDYSTSGSYPIYPIKISRFYNCSVFLLFEGTGYDAIMQTARIIDIYSYFYNSIVEFVDLPIYSVNTSEAAIAYAEYTVFKMSFKYYNVKGNRLLWLSNTASHDNIWIFSYSPDSPVSTSLHDMEFGGYANLVDYGEGGYSVYFAPSSRSHLLTTGQIQSEEYLRQIGFIP